MRPLVARLAALAAVWAFLAPPLRAHEGPPFPIVMDQRSGPYVISVWTDPDVGTGKFFVILAAAPGTTLPTEIEVMVCVQPISGRLEEVCAQGEKQDLRDRVQYYAEVPFDQQELWHVRVQVRSPAGSGEVSAEVEATPPGFGRWDLLIYAFPFLLFGGLYLFAALRRKRTRSAASPPPSSESHGPSDSLPATHPETRT